ncbi:hypothetical protein Q31a_08100 [Aureliella helgolandensis]|uniref:Uncharacterized protein n=1 Tax=Aureliella helgolandensis TaxID=2527968 RepID=A0A518G1S0_9BACT|nr:hypothetical protein Q31a_08100 [Aureliella helgolandensis]
MSRPPESRSWNSDGRLRWLFLIRSRRFSGPAHRLHSTEMLSQVELSNLLQFRMTERNWLMATQSSVTRACNSAIESVVVCPAQLIYCLPAGPKTSLAWSTLRSAKSSVWKNWASICSHSGQPSEVDTPISSGFLITDCRCPQLMCRQSSHCVPRSIVYRSHK